MKTVYPFPSRPGWLLMLWLIGLALPLRAQLTIPPAIQWQQVIEGGITAQSQVRLAKATTGDIGVLNGTALSILTAAGVLKSTAAVEGSIPGNAVLTTAGLAPTRDGGFVVLASDATNLYVVKKDANQNRIWSTIIATPSTGQTYAGLDVLPTDDGGYLVFASHSVSTFLAALTVAKVNSVGAVLWTKELLGGETALGLGTNVRFFTKVVAGLGGGFLILGGTQGFNRRPYPNAALIVTINGVADLLGSRTANDNALVQFIDGVANPYEGNSFFLLGVTDPNFSGTYSGPTYPFKLGADGSLTRLGRFTLNSVSRLATDGSGQPYYATLEGYGSGGSDFVFSGFNDQSEGQQVWSKIWGGSGADVPQAILPTGDGFVLAGTTTSTDGDVRGKSGNALATWVFKINKAAAVTAPNVLTINVLAYDCNSGLLTLGVSGGNGAPVEYRIAGIRDWATSNTFTIPSYQRQGTTFTLEARQAGQQVSHGYTAACGSNTSPQPPTSPGFYLRAPNYDCTTGKLTALYSNGTGGPVEYRIAGLRDWGTSPDFTVPPWQLVGTPFTIEGRLTNGATSTIVFVTACGAGETTNPTPPAPGLLTLSNALYNCATGQLTLITSGGDGTPISYRIPGLADWQPSSVFLVPPYQRTNAFMFVANLRQGNLQVDVSVTAYCQGSARMAALAENQPSLNATLLPNPVVGSDLLVEVTGASGLPVDFALSDLNGRVLTQQQAIMTSDRQRQTIPVGPMHGGLYLLRVSAGTQLKVLKVMKQ